MRKNSVKILSGLLGVTALFTIAGGIFAWNSSSVFAEELGEKDYLISPVFYEEYLPLNAPMDIAYNEYYTAIADGNTVFVYDRQKQSYAKYEHEVSGGSMDTVKKIQLGSSHNLYFADNSSGDNFYELNLRTLEITQKFDAIACNTFIIDGETLYFANSVGALFSTSLVDETSARKPLPLNNDPRKPTLAFWNDELYFTDNGATQILYKINPDEGIPTQVATPENTIEYMSIQEGVLTYTCSSGGFFAYSLNSVTESGLIFSETDGVYESLSSYGDWVHIVNGDKIRRFSLSEKDFTAFEICSSSNSPHRLDGARDLTLDGDTAYILDDGNKRVLTYDTKTSQFINDFPVGLSGEYIAATDGSFIVLSKTKAELYKDGVKAYENDAFEGNIVGVSGVYGNYYLATDKNYCYRLSQTDGVWTLKEIRKTSTRYPSLLTADAYGNLYIKSGAYLYAFSEEEFLTADEEGVQVCDNLPATAQKLAVDYEKNIYALSQNKVYKNGEIIDYSTPLVYAENVTIGSFAFGIEEPTALLLADGNYIFASVRLALPTVKSIPVDNADEKVFKEESAEFSVVETKENALLIAFDLAQLKDATYFPYLSYKRSSEPQKALKIGETDKYSLIAIFNAKEQKYETFVVLHDACLPLAKEEFSTVYPIEEQKAGYITSEVNLYKFPYLTELLTVRKLPRNAKITLLGEITQLDHEYYHIAYGEYTGFVPKSFVSGISASPPQSTTEVYGETENNDDGAFRLTYILLGTAIIGILADYLLLKNKRKEEK